MASDPERKHTDRPGASAVAANGPGTAGSPATATRSANGSMGGSAAVSAPTNGAAPRGRPSPLSLFCEITGDPLHRQLIGENRQLARRLRGLEGELRTLRQALRRATSDALTDPLTGLANRRAFDAALGALTTGATTGATTGPAGGGWVTPAQLLIADIDSFKALNDAHGHDFGDAVLRITGQLLAASVRRDSTVARLGGDEFALLQPGQTAPSQAKTRAIAERLCARIAERPLTVRGQPGRFERITLSIGIAGWQPGEHPADWYARADRALYAAKRGGRNRVVVDAG